MIERWHASMLSFPSFVAYFTFKIEVEQPLLRDAADPLQGHADHPNMSL